MHPDLIKAMYMTGEYKLKSEFTSDPYRETVLQRSLKYAGWTLPHIFPDDDVVEDEEMQNDFQSVGAQAVTSLGNKIVMALFQPSRPFFKMNLTKEQREDVEDMGLSSAEVDESLAKTERDAMHELGKINARVVITDAVQQLIVTGNGLLYMPPDDDMLVYSLNDYIVQRNLAGKMTKLIIRETKIVAGLSDKHAETAMSHNYRHNDEVSIYTGIMLVGKNRYIVWQELEDICYCHAQIGSYTKDTLPYLPLTWNLVRGKNYGTGLVENYAGDFHSLSTTAEALLDFTTIVTDVKVLVNPSGQTDVKAINEAASGQYVYGVEEDLFVHSANIGTNVDMLENRFTSIERRLGAAFLMNTSVTRDAERVTAEEIRMQAQELESSLGGVYSRLATELQLPLAKRLLKKLDDTFKDIEPLIVTGFEALSRNSDLDNVRAFLRDLALVTEVPEEMREWLEMSDMIATLGTGHGVDYAKFLRTKEAVEAARKVRRQEVADEAQRVAQAEQGQQQNVPN